MDWSHALSAFYGASFALLFAWGAYRVSLEKRDPAPAEEEEEEPMDKDERDQIDRAFDALDAQEGVGGDLANNVFPLPSPRSRAKAVEVQPSKPKAEDKIIKAAEGHPCRFLDATTPDHFRAGECQGLCRHPAQSGRICFWVANVATQCSYFDPKVRPRVKLKTIA
jgi:hypothetical protein